MAAKCEHFRYNNKEIRIVMVGKTGAGKSASANNILGKKVFKSMFSPGSVTEECGRADCELDGQKVSVIDTPGLFDTKVDRETICKNIAQCVAYASPGPHIFLIVIKLGRFTEEEKETVQMIQQIFGEEADKYSMVLFTYGDLLEGTTIEEFLRKSEELQELVEKCNGQYHVFNNKELKDRSQVTELLNKIRNITEKNGGNHYTTKKLQEAERVIEEEKERIMKEEAEEMRREEEALRRKWEKEYEQRIREAEDKKERERELRAELQKEQERTTAELREQQEREARKRAEESKRVTKTIAVIVGVAAGIAVVGIGAAAAGAAGAAAGAAGAAAGAGAAAATVQAAANAASAAATAASACSIS